MSANCPFHWHENPRPSVFATDSKFVGYSTGKTASQTMSEATDRKTAATGRNPGTVYGMSTKADKRAEQTELARRAKRSR